MALPPVFRGVACNVKRHTRRCVKKLRMVVAAGATGVGAQPSVRYDLQRRDLLWAGFAHSGPGKVDAILQRRGPAANAVFDPLSVVAAVR
jgi:hypothetical protein